ncbi:MAG TPA: tetratricopeptide repeat protein [Nitrospirales bacterium]|nr:tetratricopeptide repeat protein [Nitrospirales bacterium]
MSRPLKLAAFLVILYAAHHLWVTQFARVVMPDPAAEAVAPAEEVPAPIPSAAPSPPPLIEPSATAPAPRVVAAGSGQGIAATLVEIQGLIARHDEHAEARLRSLSAQDLADAEVREQVAVLWNDLGTEHAKAKGPAAGLPAMKISLNLNPRDRVANMNLTQMYWELKDPALTRDYLDRMMALAPDHPIPHLVLADLLYDRDELAQALEHFELAKRYATDDPNLKAVIALVSAKVQRLEKAERGYLARTSSHFRVKFNGGEDYEIWNRVLDILEDAYRDIGQELGHFPNHPITVVLHTRETFHAATGGPAWADGLFDRLEGRIKVPTQGALTDVPWLTRVLRHEFVHAVLHDQMQSRPAAIPQWLNEGLAMHLAGDTLPELSQVTRGPVIALTNLEGSWGGLPPEAAMLAYVEGKSATRYLVDRYGMDRLRQVVATLAEGQPFPNAFERGMLISYTEFQRRWIDAINERS